MHWHLGKCKVLQLRRNSPRHQGQAGGHPDERTRVSCWTPSWTRCRDVPLWQRGLSVCRDALRVVLPAGQGRWLFLSTQCWWGHIWSIASSSGPLSTRDTWTCWSESNKQPQSWWGAGESFLLGKAEWAGTLWCGEVSGGNSSVCTNTNEGRVQRKQRQALFSHS